MTINIPKLTGDPAAFPPTNWALEEPNGLLCFGGDLSPLRLLHAYRRGIFPWFDPGEPILWWSPDPRWILRPANLRISKRDRQFFKSCNWQVRADAHFADVIAECAKPRANSGIAPGQPHTWISSEIRSAYQHMFELGHAHCIGIYEHDQLIAGIYGVAIGAVFFGESMFGRKSNASKAALLALVAGLGRAGYAFLDCQVHTEHVEQRGAAVTGRQEFERLLDVHCLQSALPVDHWEEVFPIRAVAELA
jgi:leucyl/phenylalanyl-tRNA---protein transferase